MQLAYNSTISPEGVVEDVMVSIDSWEYPTNFLVLQPKTKFNGYPIILGRPWLVTTDAYISCRVGNMTIKNGPLSKQLVLYLLSILLLNMIYLFGWRMRKNMKCGMKHHTKYVPYMLLS